MMSCLSHSPFYVHTTVFQTESKDKAATADDAELDVARMLPDDFDLYDAQECRFETNSFKMVYVCNSDADFYMYKRNSFTKAAKVWFYTGVCRCLCLFRYSAGFLLLLHH